MITIKDRLMAARNRLPIFVNKHFLDKKRKNLKYKILSYALFPLGLIEQEKLKKVSLVSQKNKNFQYKMIVVSIMKNEAPYIKEWIKYYLSIGVEYFYIYNNNSSDSTEEILNSFSEVTCINYPGELRQLDAYNDALNRFKNIAQYITVVDADEFIFCPNEFKFNLYQFVEKYLSHKEVAGLGIHWLIFGSSHLMTQPEGLVTENYVYRSKTNFYKNKHVKTIINPRKILGYTNAHLPIPLPGYKIVNENYKIIDSPASDSVTVNKIRINHYFTKSKEEFMKKRNRGLADNVGKRSMQEFQIHDKNDVFDDAMKGYNKKNNLDI